MRDGVQWRLSVMMFLEYVVWGSWLPLLALYLTRALHFTGTEIGWIFATQAIASVTTLFVSGQIADRYLSTDRFMALSHLAAGAAMFALAFQRSFWSFFLVFLVYTLAFIPTLSLANAIAFHHLKDAQKEFGRVRLWGTIGWIAASWPFVFLLKGKEGAELDTALGSIFVVSAVASLVLAAFCLTLPRTPPAADVPRNAPFAAIRLLAVPSLAVLFLVTFLDALVHQCYFQWTSPFLSGIGIPENMIMPAMSLGQISEIATMAGLGFFLQKLGWRRIMVFGILGHVVRFALYALGGLPAESPFSVPAWVVVASNLVHGFCYAFFFASVYIFVDQHFPKDARASAQGLFNLLILGIGPFIGSLLWGALGDAYTVGGVVDYTRLFLVPAGVGLLAAVILLIGFHPARAEAEAAKAA